MLLGEAHCAVDLMTGRRHLAGGLAGPGFSDGDGKQIICQVLRLQHRIGSGRRRGEMTRSDRQHVLHSLKFANRPAELHTLIGIRQRMIETALHAANHLLDPDRRAVWQKTISLQMCRRRI